MFGIKMIMVSGGMEVGNEMMEDVGVKAGRLLGSLSGSTSLNISP